MMTTKAMDEYLSENFPENQLYEAENFFFESVHFQISSIHTASNSRGKKNTVFDDMTKYSI